MGENYSIASISCGDTDGLKKELTPVRKSAEEVERVTSSSIETETV